MVSFMPRSLYPQGKSPWYPLDRRLDRPHSRSGRNSEEENSQSPLEIEPPIIQPIAQRCTTELDLRGRKWQEAGEDCIMRSFITCTLHQNVIRVIRSRRLRWEGNVARIGDMRNAYKVIIREPDGKRTRKAYP
jgi:hypothetical protein